MNIPETIPETLNTIIVYVTVFQTYRREAVLGMTTRLPISLILSCVVVDNHSGLVSHWVHAQVVTGFPAKCSYAPPAVAGSDGTPAVAQFPALISV